VRGLFQVSSLHFVGSGSLGGFFLVVGVELHELGQIELGLLEHLGLVDEDVLEGVDFVALVGDLLGDDIREDLLEKVLEGGLLALVEHDFLHLLSDLLDLGGLGVASSLNLAVLSSGESNREDSHEVAIGGLGLDESLNKGVPLLDEGAHLVSGDGDSAEVGEAVVTLDLLNLELDDSPGEIVLVVLVEIGLSDLEDAALKRVGGDVLSLGLVARGEGGNSDLEESRGTDVVPLLLVESVDATK